MYRYAVEADGGHGGCIFECVMSIAEQCHAAVPQLTIQPGANITRDWASDLEQSLQLCKIHLEHEHEHLHTHDDEKTAMKHGRRKEHVALHVQIHLQPPPSLLRLQLQRTPLKLRLPQHAMLCGV